MLFHFLLPVLILFAVPAWGQSSDQISQELEDETTLGGDIFSDFNEDLESAQVLEDERFYRYGRFFSVNVGTGLTTFTGNRGSAYDDNPPTFHLSVNYFIDFRKAIILGVEYSKHTMVLDTIVNAYKEEDNLGAIVTDMTRLFTGFKYYVDTADLGTAITYSNPYVVGRLEYWYQTNDFIDHPSIGKQRDGGIGGAVGFGLEFPIELKQSYINVEFLYHVVNFFDKYTQDYRQAIDSDDDDDDGDSTEPIEGSTYGYEDLTGNVLSLIVSYNFTW